MKAEIIVSTGEFEHIKVFPEGELEDFVKVFQDLKFMAGGDYSDGLNVLEWARLRDEFELNGGETNPEMQEAMSNCNKWQQLVINQMKLAKKNTK